jgi:CBS domain-containing protein
MGIGSGIVGFGLGYAAGMKVGDRPIRALQRTADGARMQVGSVRESAERLRAKVSSVADRTVDVRSVRDVMTPVAETVTTTTTLREAAGLMQRADIGDVVVVDGNQVQGILTDRDIAVRVVAAGRDVDTTVVSDVYSPGAVTIGPSATVQEAVELMRQNGVRRLPVVEMGQPVGVVSIGDLALARNPESLLADITAAPPNN